MTPRTVLVVDDESFVRDSLLALLEAEGCRTLGAATGHEALGILARERVDLVATDLQMPDGDGMELLEEVRATDPDLPVLVLTGVGTVPDAVRAMKAGAADFIQKPVDPDQFVHLVTRAIDRRRLLSEVRHLRHEVRDLRGPEEMVGDSPAMREIRAAIDRVAPSDATVLVTGESGTGKELVARAIHTRSPRAAAPFVRVNCAAIPEPLFESELFGHRRGAFTGATEDRTGRFAEATGGTLFLDEIGTLHAGLQAKLLRVLESGEYQVIGDSRTRLADVRVVAVTNEDLEARVEEGGFRSDLYYRLAIFPIRVPPLREHRGDIAALAGHFLARLGHREPLGEEALAALRGYGWPGNVRELRNIIERATLLAGEDRLDGALFRRILGPPTGDRAAVEDALGADLRIKPRTEALERTLIIEALAQTEGRKREAADLLGIDPRNLAYHLRKHGLGES